MTGSYCLPVSGGYTPTVVCQERKNHAVLSSALLGGTLAYGAYKFNVGGYFKDTMSKEAFEEAIRSGQDISFTRKLKGEERSLLNAAKSDVAVVDSVAFSKPKPFQSYLIGKYNNITNPNQLEERIKQLSDSLAEGGSLGSQVKRAEGKLPEIERAQALSDKLREMDKRIKDISSKPMPLDEYQNLRNLQAERAKWVKDLQELMKKVGITPETIGKVKANSGNSFYTTIEAALRDTSDTRKHFFNQHLKDAAKEYETISETLQKESGKIVQMHTDLALVKAAQANGGLITEELARGINESVGEAIDKGEKSIATAFEALKSKLPKQAGNWKKAGLLGAVVALCIYCFKDY